MITQRRKERLGLIQRRWKLVLRTIRMQRIFGGLVTGVGGESEVQSKRVAELEEETEL